MMQLTLLERDLLHGGGVHAHGKTRGEKRGPVSKRVLKEWARLAQGTNLVRESWRAGRLKKAIQNQGVRQKVDKKGKRSISQRNRTSGQKQESERG